MWNSSDLVAVSPTKTGHNPRRCRNHGRESIHARRWTARGCARQRLTMSLTLAGLPCRYSQPEPFERFPSNPPRSWYSLTG